MPNVCHTYSVILSNFAQKLYCVKERLYHLKSRICFKNQVKSTGKFKTELMNLISVAVFL